LNTKELTKKKDKEEKNHST